jgi:two-component system nitrate/nitrite response regulator NarP
VPSSSVKRIELIIADKSPLVLSGLKELIARDHRFRVVGVVANGRAFLAEVRKRRIDVGVIGWEMPLADGRMVLEALRGQDRPPPIVVYTGAVDATVPRQVMALGGAGFVSKSEPPERLLTTLAEVAAGRMVFPFVDVRLLDRAHVSVLTAREQELLQALVSGASNQVLADRFGVSLHTVKFHLKNVYAKLEVANRAQAVAYFMSNRGR